MAQGRLRLLAGAALLATGVTLTPVPVLAKAAAKSASVGIPRRADGHPDFSGIWQTLSEADYDLEPHAGRRDAPPGPGVVEGGAIPYRPEALDRRRQNFTDRAKADPRLRCYVLGASRAVWYHAPFQILQRHSDLTLVHQFGNQVRVVHTDGSGHPKVLDDNFWLGDSRGRWEGDTLVVDITNFNGETWLDRSGNYTTDKLHVVERWSFIDKDTIRYRATFDDATVYARPWTVEVLLNRRREPGFRLIEDYCYTLEYADHYPHKDGQ